MSPKAPLTPTTGRVHAIWHLAWVAPLGLAVLAFLSAPAVTPVDGLQQIPPADTVTVRAQCTGNGRLGAVMVDPWTVYLPEPGDDRRRNGEIVWVLDNDSDDADRIVVEPKQPANWPFQDTRHEATGRGQGRAASSRRMLRELPARAGRAQARRVQRGDRYQYNITVYCTVGGESYTVVIDPDVEVGGGV